MKMPEYVSKIKAKMEKSLVGGWDSSVSKKDADESLVR